MHLLKRQGWGLSKIPKCEDPLFTEDGFRDHADEALSNGESISSRPGGSCTRDPVRKLGWDDRLLGLDEASVQMPEWNRYY